MAARDREEDRLYADPELVRFYDLENDGGPDQDYCRSLAPDARSVLDLGCGTGQLAASLSQGLRVTGVDPAPAMLDVARARPGGERVRWVMGDAREIRLGETFDLVVLTGHAFQVFLTREDQLAALRTIAAHLAPTGRFIFDSRNPDREEWREWTPDRSQRVVEHPELGAVRAWNDVVHDAGTGVVTYETHYEAMATGGVVSASSRIAFPDRETIRELTMRAGLEIVQWLGDWSGNPYQTGSPEIIPIGGLSKRNASG
jgi:SAM-dependent methyltransferase